MEIATQRLLHVRKNDNATRSIGKNKKYSINIWKLFGRKSDKETREKIEN